MINIARKLFRNKLQSLCLKLVNLDEKEIAEGDD
jgi:hypothetical protein